MKILYLFNRVRTDIIRELENGRENDNSFFGMYRLPHFGIQAEHLEIEQFFSPKFASFLRRRILNIHYVHLPLFTKFFKYDIVFTSTAFGSLLAKAIFRLKRPKWVMFDFSISGMVGKAETLKQKIFRFMISRGVDGIITISEEEARRIKKLFPKLSSGVQFIPLGTDTHFFNVDPAIQEDGGILTVGRDPYRDLGTFVRAFSDTAFPVTLIARSNQIQKLGKLPPHFTLKNPTSLDLVKEYARAKVFVLPLVMKDRLNEAVGCSTLVEAMAMGKAIVATRTFTMESYITDGENGILVPEGDAEALKKAVLDLLNDEPKRKRLGAEARRFAEKYCDAEKFAESLSVYFKKMESS